MRTTLLYLLLMILAVKAGAQMHQDSTRLESRQVSEVVQFNVLGKPGYILAPSAVDVPGPFQLSAAWVPPKLSFSSERWTTGSPDGTMLYHFGVSLTDFLLINLNVTRGIGRDDIGIGDRHLDVRLRIFKERKNRPALALHVSPPGPVTNYLAHNALVATKFFDLGKRNTFLETTAGYGFPYYFGGLNAFTDDKLEIRSKREEGLWYLNGFFGAVSIHPMKWASVAVEITNRTVAAALTFRLKNRLIGQFNWIGEAGFGFSVQGNIRLDREASELRQRRFKTLK